MPPTRNFAACLKQAERDAADDGAAVVAEAAERHRHETIEIQQRAIGKEGQQQLAAGKPGNTADHPGERVAGDAQIALGQPSARAAKLSSAIAMNARPTSVRR